MIHFPDVLRQRMQVRKNLHLWRSLTTQTGIDFTSNDYLGFSLDPELREHFDAHSKSQVLTSSGSRLLRGELEIYSETEKACADFSAQSAALLYPSGYQANIGLLSALLTADDQVFSDELNHASIIDGIKLSGARKSIYRHRDLNHLEAQLISAREKSGLKLIVSESVFSMDGSLAPLAEIIALAQKYSAQVVIDEAHATGLWGSGWAQTLGLSKQILATTHTGGKTLGASGAWVACSPELRHYLIQFSRGFIYSTAPFPLQALLLKLSLEHWQRVGVNRSEVLLRASKEFQSELRLAIDESDLFFLPEVTGPILPLTVGNSLKTLNIALTLQEKGFDIRAIRPPTVAEGSARLRIILHWQNTASEKERLIQALKTITKNEVRF